MTGQSVRDVMAMPAPLFARWEQHSANYPPAEYLLSVLIMLFYKAHAAEGADAMPLHIVGRWLGWEPKTDKQKVKEAEAAHVQLAREALDNLNL